MASQKKEKSAKDAPETSRIEFEKAPKLAKEARSKMTKSRACNLL